jgi:hypothetical protein
MINVGFTVSARYSISSAQWSEALRTDSRTKRRWTCVVGRTGGNVVAADQGRIQVSSLFTRTSDRWRDLPDILPSGNLWALADQHMHRHRHLEDSFEGSWWRSSQDLVEEGNGMHVSSVHRRESEFLSVTTNDLPCTDKRSISTGCVSTLCPPRAYILPRSFTSSA